MCNNAKLEIAIFPQLHVLHTCTICFRTSRLHQNKSIISNNRTEGLWNRSTTYYKIQVQNHENIEATPNLDWTKIKKKKGVWYWKRVKITDWVLEKRDLRLPAKLGIATSFPAIHWTSTSYSNNQWKACKGNKIKCNQSVWEMVYTCYSPYSSHNISSWLKSWHSGNGECYW